MDILQSWCGSSRPELQLRWLRSFPHSPRHIRLVLSVGDRAKGGPKSILSTVTDVCIVSYHRRRCMLLETISRRTFTPHIVYDTLTAFKYL